jgi:hypothetical protein
MKKLEDIFFIKYGNKFDMNKMVVSSEGVNFVTRTSKGNGVTSKVHWVAGVEPFARGLITVALGGSVLSSFLQLEQFYTGQNIAVLMPKDVMSNAQKLFYCFLISLNSYRYSACGREANKTLKSINLPELSEFPEWIDSVFESFGFECARAARISCVHPPVLDKNKWRTFTYDDIFLIQRGQPLYKKNLKNGPYPYISATSINNGVNSYCSEFNQSGNAITLAYDGSIGESFFQKSNFFASEKIAVLRVKPEWCISLNASIAMFLITIIKKEKFRFNYGLKWAINSRMKKTKINLPVDFTGKPDWDFMCNYISSLPYSSNLS